MRLRFSSSILGTTSIATLVAVIMTAGPTTASAAPSPKKKVGGGGQTARGKGGNFGLGLSLGDVMGPTMKLWLHPNHALQWDIG
jgi:hypothetical protein